MPGRQSRKWPESRTYSQWTSKRTSSGQGQVLRATPTVHSANCGHCAHASRGCTCRPPLAAPLRSLSSRVALAARGAGGTSMLDGGGGLFLHSSQEPSPYTALTQLLYSPLLKSASALTQLLHSSYSEPSLTQLLHEPSRSLSRLLSLSASPAPERLSALVALTFRSGT